MFEPKPVMAGRPIRIGDQLVLEEDYDETYMPSEQGKRPGCICNSSLRAVFMVYFCSSDAKYGTCTGLLSVFGLDQGLANCSPRA